MNRLEQDAADALAANESWVRYRAYVKARWAKVQAAAVMAGAVRYERTPEDAQQLAQDIEAGLVPF